MSDITRPTEWMLQTYVTDVDYLMRLTGESSRANGPYYAIHMKVTVSDLYSIFTDISKLPSVSKETQTQIMEAYWKLKQELESTADPMQEKASAVA